MCVKSKKLSTNLNEKLDYIKKFRRQADWDFLVPSRRR
jgi:hypothetical protein